LALFRLHLLIVIILGCTSIILAQSPLLAAPKDDTQLWNDTQLAVPLGKTVDFRLNGTIRIGRNVTRPVDERLGIAFAFKAGKYLTVAPGWLIIGMQPSERRRSREQRLVLPLTVRFNLGRFTISDRNQFERRYRRPQGDSTRYRNGVTVEHPFSLNGLKLSWIVGDEVFYDWSFNAWVRNRFLVGVSRRFNEHLTSDFYYMRQNDGRSRPGDLHVIGTTLRIRL
jgi:hypothetical protein